MKKNKKKPIKKKPVWKRSTIKKPVKRTSFKKKSVKRKPIKKKSVKKRPFKKKSVKRKSIKKKKSIKTNVHKKKPIEKKLSFVSRIITIQNSLILKFNIKINFSLEKYIQSFFDKIANTILDYKILKAEDSRKRKLEEIEKKEKEKILIRKQKNYEEELQTKLKEKNLKEEIKLDKERSKDIKLFLRKEQAILRIEQAERQKQFLKQIKLERQIERFRIREVKELEKLERISLREKRDDYAGLQERIEKLKDKYRIIRDQKIRERVEALGVKIQGDEDRETLLQKEKDYTIASLINAM